MNKKDIIKLLDDEYNLKEIAEKYKISVQELQIRMRKMGFDFKIRNHIMNIHLQHIRTKKERQKAYEKLATLLKRNPTITNRELGESIGVSEIAAGAMVSTMRRANPSLVPDRIHGIKVDWDSVKEAYKNA